MINSKKPDLIGYALCATLFCMFLYAFMEDGFGSGWDQREAQASSVDLATTTWSNDAEIWVLLPDRVSLYQSEWLIRSVQEYAASPAIAGVILTYHDKGYPFTDGRIERESVQNLDSCLTILDQAGKLAVLGVQHFSKFGHGREVQAVPTLQNAGIRADYPHTQEISLNAGERLWWSPILPDSAKYRLFDLEVNVEQGLVNVYVLWPDDQTISKAENLGVGRHLIPVHSLDRSDQKVMIRAQTASVLSDLALRERDPLPGWISAETDSGYLFKGDKTCGFYFGRAGVRGLEQSSSYWIVDSVWSRFGSHESLTECFGFSDEITLSYWLPEERKRYVNAGHAYWDQVVEFACYQEQVTQGKLWIFGDMGGHNAKQRTRANNPLRGGFFAGLTRFVSPEAPLKYIAWDDDGEPLFAPYFGREYYAGVTSMRTDVPRILAKVASTPQSLRPKGAVIFEWGQSKMEPAVVCVTAMQLWTGWPKP